MDYSAKDATILTLISSQPTTRHFDRLIEHADSPRTREIAEYVRERAGGVQMSSVIWYRGRTYHIGNLDVPVVDVNEADQTVCLYIAGTPVWVKAADLG